MGRSRAVAPDPIDDFRAVIVGALRSRRTEIALAIRSSIAAGEESATTEDVEFNAGRDAAIAAIVTYGLEVVQRGPDETQPIPAALASQVRLAAQRGVRLGKLIHRYVAGQRRFIDFVVEEAKKNGYLHHEQLLVEQLRRAYRALTDHIIDSIEQEYNQERGTLRLPHEQRRLNTVRRLLAQEPVAQAEIGRLQYDLSSSSHIAVIGVGVGVRELLRQLSRALECALLSVDSEHEAIWAWLGSSRELIVADLQRMFSACRNIDASLAIGEPGMGIAGWRRSHHQALTAVPLARHEPKRFVRCVDALPIAAALQDVVIRKMFFDTYLVPLDELHKGQAVRETLRMYLKHHRNVSSAAVALKKSRRTVETDLSAVAKIYGHPVPLSGLEIALQLEELARGSR